MFKSTARFFTILGFSFVVGCSPKPSSTSGSPVSVKTELSQLNPDSMSGSSRSLTSSDIQYIESQVALTPDQKAALLEVSQ